MDFVLWFFFWGVFLWLFMCYVCCDAVRWVVWVWLILGVWGRYIRYRAPFLSKQLWPFFGIKHHIIINATGITGITAFNICLDQRWNCGPTVKLSVACLHPLQFLVRNMPTSGHFHAAWTMTFTCGQSLSNAMSLKADARWGEYSWKFPISIK